MQTGIGIKTEAVNEKNTDVLCGTETHRQTDRQIDRWKTDRRQMGEKGK